MPEDQQKPSNRSAADKERSKQQSRSISGKEAARTSGGSKGSAKKSQPTNNSARRAAQRQASAEAAKGNRGPGGRARRPGSGRSRRAIYTWGVVALVVVVVVVVVVVAVTSGSNNGNNGSTAITGPAPASVVNDIQTVPASVFNTVGITSSSIPVSPPSVVKKDLNPLTYTVNGKSLPGTLYYGAEYCPYCAAERWALAAAFARFGKFKDLYITQSSSTDVYPNTPTLSFVNATFTSPYVALKTVEAENREEQPLQTPTADETKLLTKYDTSQYVKGLSSEDNGAIPFIDFGNKVIQSGAAYLPSSLTGLTHEQIAANLHDPSNAVTQAIITDANYMSAAICASTHGNPGSVCNSKGVHEAAKALDLKF